MEFRPGMEGTVAVLDVPCVTYRYRREGGTATYVCVDFAAGGFAWRCALYYNNIRILPATAPGVIAIKDRSTGAILYESAGTASGDVLQDVLAARVDLGGANLQHANLSGANLDLRSTPRIANPDDGLGKPFLDGETPATRGLTDHFQPGDADGRQESHKEVEDSGGHAGDV
jgi:hypothetical protein